MQTANYGSINLGRFQNWFSFPTDPRFIYLEESYKQRTSSYADFIGEKWKDLQFTT